METWDLFDETRQPLGCTQKRGEPTPPGLYHVAVCVWTVNSHNEILLTLRHPDKDLYPNYWENTGGAVQAGESSKAGAIRELFEETGIRADEAELVYLGSRREETAFFDSYIVRKDVPLNQLRLQEMETVDAQWVDLDRLDAMMASGEVALPVWERLVPVRADFEKFIFSHKQLLTLLAPADVCYKMNS